MIKSIKMKTKRNKGPKDIVMMMTAVIINMMIATLIMMLIVLIHLNPDDTRKVTI